MNPRKPNPTVVYADDIIRQAFQLTSAEKAKSDKRRFKKPKPQLDGITFDSKEEVEFYMWCKEAKLQGFIREFLYQPEPFILSGKVTREVTKTVGKKTKQVERHLLHPHTYRPDFIIRASSQFHDFTHGLTDSCEPRMFYIDIKGAYEPVESKAALFSINQKWVYSKFGVYVNKVVPKHFFAKTFAPAIHHKRTGQLLTKYSECKSVQDVTKEN